MDNRVIESIKNNNLNSFKSLFLELSLHINYDIIKLFIEYKNIEMFTNIINKSDYKCNFDIDYRIRKSCYYNDIEVLDFLYKVHIYNLSKYNYYLISEHTFDFMLIWSNIDPNIAYMLNDYKYIYINRSKINKIEIPCKLTYKDTLTIYNQSKNYILTEINKDKNIKCILLTHHGVHPNCNGKFKGNELSSAFASSIPELYGLKNLIACINGHVHQNLDELIPETNIKLLSNCLGYKSEHLDCDLNKEIDLSSI